MSLRKWEVEEKWSKTAVRDVDEVYLSHSCPQLLALLHHLYRLKKMEHEDK